MVMAQPTQTELTCWSIHALTSPTFHAVMRSPPNLVGFGNFPSRTRRQNVAGLKGNGAGRVGCLGSRTSCDCLTHALSGSESKLGIVAVWRVAVVIALGMVALVCFFKALGAGVVRVIWYSVEAQPAAVYFGGLLCDGMKVRTTRSLWIRVNVVQPYAGGFLRINDIN